MPEATIHENGQPRLPENKIRSYFEFPLSAFRISRCLRNPETLFRRSSRASASSVSLFPRERMRDITSERFALVKISDIQRFTVISRECQTPLHLNRRVRKHPVVKSRPLGIARI